MKRLVLRLPGHSQTTENEPLPSPTHFSRLFISSMALGLQQEHETELRCLLDYPTDATVAAPEGGTVFRAPQEAQNTGCPQPGSPSPSASRILDALHG